jgi:hypothetical protein
MKLRDGGITLTGGMHAMPVLPSHVIAYVTQLHRLASLEPAAASGGAVTRALSLKMNLQRDDCETYIYSTTQ